MKDIKKSNDDHVWVWKEKTAWTEKAAVKCVEKWVKRDTSNLSDTESL